MNWGSPMFSILMDSQGDTLDQSYAFELGAFVPDFAPDETNVEEWAANWRTFDRAAYNGFETPEDDGIYGYFTSSVQMTEGGHSSNPAYSSLGLNFQDLPAYVWIYNSTNPVPGTEWLLARSDSWIFPSYVDCCENDPPLQWSVSDLDTEDVPLYGSQGGVPGAGVFTNTDVHTLQTYTFVPEPSSLIFVSLAGSLMVLRRRRHS